MNSLLFITVAPALLAADLEGPREVTVEVPPPSVVLGAREYRSAYDYAVVWGPPPMYALLLKVDFKTEYVVVVGWEGTDADTVEAKVDGKRATFIRTPGDGTRGKYQRIFALPRGFTHELGEGLKKAPAD